MIMRKLVVSSFVLVLVACGSETTPTDDAPAPTPSTNADGTSSFAPSADLTSAPDTTSPCATVSVESSLTPVDLVVMYDQSGSMGDRNENPSYDPDQRWNPVAAAMKSFFSDDRSAGISAQLTFFATTSNACDVATYSIPEVPRAALPNAIFADTIALHRPKGDTPTRAAVLGALAQAEANAAAHPDARTAVVLVTDGDPWGCGITSSAAAATEVQGVVTEVKKAKFPVYVVGVGPDIANVQDIAAAGNTKAFHVDVGNAKTTTDELIAAMETIRGGVGACSLDIPSPPDGRSLDLDKVRVALAKAGAADQVLDYSANCSDPNGFRFDDAKKKILLCQSSCDTSKATAKGAAKVQFACTNRPDVVR